MTAAQGLRHRRLTATEQGEWSNLPTAWPPNQPASQRDRGLQDVGSTEKLGALTAEPARATETATLLW